MFVLLSAFGVDWQTELKEQFVSDSSIQSGEYNYGIDFDYFRGWFRLVYNT